MKLKKYERFKNLNVTQGIKTKTKNFRFNFGPQHPAAHGVLRLIIHLNAERIVKVDPHIGLLHRGTEKLIEKKNYIQALPYLDRLDYVSAMSQEHCFSLIIETLLEFSISLRDSFIRILFLELTRILNHLMAITTHAIDLGALTPFLWGFEDREIIMEFYEKVSGARLHASYIKPGGISLDLPFDLLNDIYFFCLKFLDRIDEMESVLTFNSIWKYRLCNIGIVSQEFARTFSFSGVMLRSTGIFLDLRESQPYELYNKLFFKIFVGEKGDCYERYLIRIWEMRESVYIIFQCIDKIRNSNKENKPYSKHDTFFLKDSMESMICHFISKGQGSFFKNCSNYIGTETPKGEFGIFLVTQSNSYFLYKCKFRAPGFFHLQSLNALAKEHSLGDLVAIIGSQDIVFGEIDR